MLAYFRSIPAQLLVLSFFSVGAVSLSAHASESGTGYEKSCISTECQDKMERLSRLAWRGSPEAQVIAAAAMVHGDGLEQNVRQGRLYLKQSMRSKHPVAWYTYAIWRYNGTAYEQDEQAAREAMMYAADELDYPPAMYYLAAQAILQQKDSATAVDYLQRAALKKHHDAQYLYAQLLASGVGVEQDLEQAATLFNGLRLRQFKNSEELYQQTMVALAEVIPPETFEAIVAEMRPPENTDVEVIEVNGQRISVDEMALTMVDYIESFGLYDGSGISNIAGQVCGFGTAMCHYAYSSRSSDADPQRLFNILSQIRYGNAM